MSTELLDIDPELLNLPPLAFQRVCLGRVPFWRNRLGEKCFDTHSPQWKAFKMLQAARGKRFRQQQIDERKAEEYERVAARIEYLASDAYQKHLLERINRLPDWAWDQFMELPEDSSDLTIDDWLTARGF